MEIKISTNLDNGQLQYSVEREVKETNEKEEAICRQFIEASNREEKEFTIEKRSQEYTTLFYRGIWFVRVKYTTNTKWIQIQIMGLNKDRDLVLKEISEDFRFSGNERIVIEDDDSICKLFPIVNDQIEQFIEAEEKRSTASGVDQIIFEDIKKLLLECGAEEKYIEYEKLSDRSRVCYLGSFLMVSYKTYKKKKSMLYYYDDQKEFDNISDIKDWLVQRVSKRIDAPDKDFHIQLFIKYHPE